MRRISLALALLGAVAATGCGGSKSSGSDASKGVNAGTFYVNVNQPPVGGSISTGDGKINCGASSLGTPTPNAAGDLVTTPVYLDGANVCPKQTAYDKTATVTVTATPAAGFVFVAWAGDCSGSTPTCSLTGPADKTPIAIFSKPGAAGHPNFMDPALHGPAYLAFSTNQAGALQCTNCHGANMLGQGIAVSCASCHTWPLGKHFDTTADAWSDHVNSSPCYRCHTDLGFQTWVGVGVTGTASYLGGTAGTYQGSSFTTTGTVTGPLKCASCHNSVSDPLGTGITTVIFPSGAKFTDLDKSSAVCAQCHMARKSTADINTAVKTGTADAQISGTPGFQNPHYRGAAATLFGKDAQGWYQYTGNNYTGRNAHGGVASCTFCHDAHTGELPKDSDISAKCGSCHSNDAGLPVANFLELEETRQYGFEGDIDGLNGPQSLKQEIDGLGTILLQAIQQYATVISGKKLCYLDSANPYFFYDNGYIDGTNFDATAAGDGQCSAAEAVSANQYKSFTPRLMKAAYNYKWYKADPGAWAHNPRYAIEVLFDSITDLNTGLGASAVPFAGKRSFNGHFGAADAGSPYAAFVYSFTQGAMGFTSDACIQCHGGQNGFQTYLTGAPAAMPAGSKDVVANKVTGMQCATCHALTGTDMKSLRTIQNVYFPPGYAAGTAGMNTVAGSALPESFAVCATCHSGRDNGVTAFATVKAGFTNGIKNPHYLGAAAIILGNVSNAMYQYAGQTYAAQAPFFNTATPTADQGPHGSPHGARCVGCHDPKQTNHAFEVNLDTTVPQGIYTNGHVNPPTSAPNTKTCNGCHTGNYALSIPKANLDALAAQLITAMQNYATSNSQPVPCYNAVGSHGSYFFVQAGDGTCPTTTTYATADSHLAQAGFNYIWYGKEPGAYAHNYDYVAQVLYDAIVDLGGTPTVARP